jgi:hypothetical protein
MLIKPFLTAALFFSNQKAFVHHDSLCCYPKMTRNGCHIGFHNGRYLDIRKTLISTSPTFTAITDDYPAKVYRSGL